jgi:hypothetical protein
MARAQIALIIPLGDAPGHIPGLHPDQGLPGGGNGGEYPDQGLPGRPPHVGNRPPGSWDRPIDPGYGWGGGERPSTGPVRPGRPVDPSWGLEEGHPDQGLPPTRPGVPAQPWVPPTGEELPPPPEEIADQVVLAIWNPTTSTWAVKTKPPVQPTPHG